MVGLAVKPAVGVLDFVSQTTNGLKNSSQHAFKLVSTENSDVAFAHPLESSTCYLPVFDLRESSQTICR